MSAADSGWIIPAFVVVAFITGYAMLGFLIKKMKPYNETAANENRRADQDDPSRRWK